MITFSPTNGMNSRVRKLDSDRVQMIRLAFDHNFDEEVIAKIFNVSVVTIRKIGRRTSWTSLPELTKGV